eukprot:8257682-Ditylum_brightwellii.AAC.1
MDSQWRDLNLPYLAAVSWMSFNRERGKIVIDAIHDRKLEILKVVSKSSITPGRLGEREMLL